MKKGERKKVNVVGNGEGYISMSQQFSVKINPLWYLDSERKRNLFFAKWVWGVQFCNIDISH
jgi:hypothetical protein